MAGKKIVALFLITSVVSYVFEYISSTTSFITGSRFTHYAPGPYVGPIPIIVPIGWFIVIYIVIHLTNRVIQSKNIAYRILSDITLALAFDLVADPIGAWLGLWIWETPGPYFGVPLGNFVLWAMVVGLISFIYRRFIATMKT